MTKIVTDGLLVYYNAKWNKQSAPYLEDLSGNDLHAEIDGVTLQGDVLYFDGVDDKLIMPLLPAQTSYTIELWASYIKQSSANYMLVFGDESNGFRIDNESGITNLRVMQAGQSRSGANSGVDYSGQMVQYILLYDASTKTVERYMDGNPLSSLTYVADMQFDAGQGVIGANGLAGGWGSFYGDLAVFRIYERKLTPTEVVQNRAVGTDIGLDEGLEVSYLAPMNQQIYKVYSDKYDTVQQFFLPAATNYSIVSTIYRNILAMLNTEQQVSKQITTLSPTLQTIWFLYQTDYPMLLSIVPSYTQSVHFKVSIQRTVKVTTLITKLINIEVKI
ncbi:LamG-like jellyroll fold domain-containing protein [Paenibacillus yanchengensis]|uniref:LamG-like jellyroll fold domain-containing protein n=1 Tax=Paenibacillus yanchengensis TaxID=2035833 RepID=A0ABW4YP50_9BACL